MQTATDERTEMLKAAIAKCFAAREAVNVANVRAKLPPDFFEDFDTGEPLADEIVFAEIQATYTAAPKAAAMVEQTPDGRPLAPVEDFPDYLPPSDNVAAPGEPVAKTTAAPVVEDATASHAASGPEGPTPQQRLDGARAKAGNLLALRPSLINAQKVARADLAEKIKALQLADPNRTTPEIEAARFRETSQRERAARVARESGGGPDRIAYVDAERKYSQGGDANAMARRRNVTGNRRGAFSRQSLGQVNRDPSRGATPAPVAVRPTIPALAK